MPPRYKLIACEVLKAEVERLREETGASPDVDWMEMGLHDEPEKLRAALGDAVAATMGKGYDAVLLLFGLCANGTDGLRAGDAPLVIPRAHDCITLYLGTRERYAGEYRREPGTYWFSRGFLHRESESLFSGGGLLGHAAGESGASAAERERIYQQYVEEYGEENAAFLMEAWVDGWKRNYTRAVLLAWDHPALESDRARVRAFAEENGWRYEEMPVDLRLARKLLAGDWPEDEFAVVPPGGLLRATHDDCVLGCPSRL